MSDLITIETFLAAFGCAGNFGYATLQSNRKNLEADANNPNLYSSIDDDAAASALGGSAIKDNRKLENLYDEIRRKNAAGEGA